LPEAPVTRFSHCQYRTPVYSRSLQSADSIRELAIAAYFSQLLPRHLAFLDGLTACAPLAVRFSTVALCFHPELARIPDTHAFAALNLTLVALCAADASQARLPLPLTSSPPNHLFFS
jgi:hypothetical protein